MLDVVRSAAHRRALAAAFDVEILSLATANPPFRLSQEEAAVYAKQLYPQLSKLWQLYDNTGIECRYNCEPIEWYLKPRSWQERTTAFRQHALDLLEEITIKTTERAGVALNDVDMIVTNTVTGLAIPSLDALLLNRLKLAPTIERLPMFGLGCGAGVAGLSRAARLAHAKDGALVLFLTVDLCSLCLRVNDPSPAMFVSTALFGDGAAGLLLHNTRSGARSGPRILTSGEWCWGNTEHIMGWDIKDDGFGIVLSRELPSLMKKALAPALNDFLERNGLALGDFNGFLFHPVVANCSKPWRRCWGLPATSSATLGRCCAVTEICPRRRRCLFWKTPFSAEHVARICWRRSVQVSPRTSPRWSCDRIRLGRGAPHFSHAPADCRVVVGETERTQVVRCRRRGIRPISPCADCACPRRLADRNVGLGLRSPSRAAVFGHRGALPNRAVLGTGDARTPLDDSHYRRSRRKAGDARSLPMAVSSELCGGDRRDRGGAAGARTAALCARFLHSQCRGSCDPHSGRKCSVGGRRLRTDPLNRSALLARVRPSAIGPRVHPSKAAVHVSR